MAITISGQNNNDKILASDGVLDQISGFNVVGVMTATTFNVTTKHTANHIDVGSSIQLGNAGIITATTLIGNVTGNVNSTSHLLLQISGSEKFRVGNGGQLGIGGANYGTSGQVLTSGGSGSAATWSTINGTTINNNAANKVIMGSNTANTLEAVAKSTLFGNLSHGQNFLDDNNLIFGDASDMILIHQASGAKSRIRNTNDSGSLDIESTLTRFTNKDGSSEKLRITSDGNIGINDTAPPNFTGYKSLSIHGSTGGALVFGDDGTDEWEIYGGDGVIKIYDRANTQERIRISDDGAIGLGGANYGTSGQVLTSGGSGSAATWTTPLNLNNATDNRVITSAGGATLNGESTLTYAEPTLEITTTNSSYGALKLDGNSGGLIEFKDNGTRKWELYGANNFSFYDRANTKYGLILKPAGDVEIPDGNLVIGTAGHGIDFSATADGGTGTPSELLDDYEEGYFAPTIENLTSGYASGTFYNRQCRYTKVGNMVTVWGHIQFWGNAATSGSDGTEFSILGFPFEVDGVGYRGTCGGSVVAQSWKYQGSGWNNYNVDSSNVQCGINGNEQIRFFVFKHDSITGTVTQKSINGYSPNIEWCFTVRVTTYK